MFVTCCSDTDIVVGRLLAVADLRLKIEFCQVEETTFLHRGHPPQTKEYEAK